MAKSNKPRKPPMYSADKPDAEALKRICELLAEGKTLKRITELEMMPNWHVVWAWQSDEVIKKQIARAREQGTYYRDDEIEEIADKKMSTMVEVAHAKLKIETRERRNARFNPEVFAERKQLPGTVAPPALPNPDADEASELEFAKQLQLMQDKLAGYAKVARGGPRMLNVTPTRKADIEGKAIRK